MRKLREKWTQEKDILIVDDETPFVRSLVEGLSLYTPHLNVLTAENGKKAVEVLKTLAVDLVITDLRMPVMDGFELMEYIRRELPDTRVIVMSMLDGPEIRRRARELGADQFLEKPVDLRTILNKILMV
jgi:YesN/AraC family two-component response regulator